jgi:sigma-B regulation protein RsbU (phosphoserine phosphatase)
MDLAADGNYRYDVQDWYTLPRDLGHSIWTEPYFDEGAGNILMVTYAVPIRPAGRTNGFLGVATCDVSLEWLTKLLGSLRVGQNGYAFLISGSGKYIAHPRSDFIMNETVFSVAEASTNAALRQIARNMIQGVTGFGELVSFVTKSPSWFAYAPVPTTRWSVGLVFPKDELLAKVITLSRNLTGLGLTGFALLLIVALAIARSISRPLRQLQSATKTLSTGNLDAPLPMISGGDEVAQLASAFEVMRNDLKAYIERLRSTTAAKERIESEIHIARSIQMSLVPRTFPPFPERRDLDMFAILDPARDIGGDFYDFFLDGDNVLCVMVGDVSGKGVPAALFMAVTRTFLRMFWRDERSPAKTLTRLNDELARDNEPSMFVTMFLARIDLSTGNCQYANGGHNPPFIIRSGSPVECVKPVQGTVVGAIEGMVFEEGSVKFLPGDTMLLYTDGVTEAMNPAYELAGDDWTIRQIEALRDTSCEKIIHGIREELRKYAAGAEQSDDITMVAFRYFGHG